jgi:hypothetical protein
MPVAIIWSAGRGLRVGAAGPCRVRKVKPAHCTCGEYTLGGHSGNLCGIRARTTHGVREYALPPNASCRPPGHITGCRLNLSAVSP